MSVAAADRSVESFNFFECEDSCCEGSNLKCRVDNAFQHFKTFAGGLFLFVTFEDFHNVVFVKRVNNCGQRRRLFNTHRDTGLSVLSHCIFRTLKAGLLLLTGCRLTFQTSQPKHQFVLLTFIKKMEGHIDIVTVSCC